MDIIIENENTQLAEYKINFEEAKQYLNQELEKYKELVVSEEFIQSAKKSRAELNAKKSELKSRLTEIKKKHNKPIDLLKSKVDELISLIDEPLNKIDEQIKSYEIKVKEIKKGKIIEIFENFQKKYNFTSVEFENIFNPRWLNTDYSIKKITNELEMFFERIVNDLKVIESFDDEFVIPLKELYLECFDMSTVMQKKIIYDKQKREKQEEVLRLLKEKEELENEIIEEEIPEEIECVQEPITDLKKETDINTLNDKEKCHTDVSTSCNISNKTLERINFWVEVTPEQKQKMREFVIKNKIRCGKLSI